MILLSLIALAQAAPTPVTNAYGFQDSWLGAGFADWRTRHPNAECGPGELHSETICRLPKPDFIERYGGVTYSFIGRDDRAEPVLWRISLVAAPINESKVYDGLVGKWGKPHTPGLYTDTWSRGGSTIRYMRLANGVSFSMTLDEVSSARDEAAKTKAAKDF